MTDNNTSRPSCAVLLAVYNGMQYLEEQIQSILNQADVEVTIFASVDLSTDGSFFWLETLAKQESRIIVLPYGDKFGGAAKNFFRLIRDVNLTGFDYIAFADQDDVWHLDKMSKASNYLKSMNYDGYSSNVMAFWPDGRTKLINKAQSQKRWDFIFESAGPGCTYVMTQKLITAIKERVLGRWNEVQKLGLHDWFCYAFARANGYSWFIDSESSMFYRQHASNQVGVNSGLKAYLNRMQQIRNGWWFSQAMLMAELVGVGEHHFIHSWSTLSRIGLLRLARSFTQCRRRFDEQLFFLFVCIMLAIVGCRDAHAA